MPTEATFSYSSIPQPIKPQRKKYRDSYEDGSLTLMSDPRVVRGNTHSMARSIANLNRSKVPESKSSIPKKIDPSNSMKNRQTYNYEITPFCSSDIDLSLFLTDKQTVLPLTNTMESQSDRFADIPPEPEHVPRKTGIDRSTQVDHNSDLFDFDAEVAPMLEVIVKKTLEQAVFEVQSEEELKALENERMRFNQERAEERQWILDREKEYAAEVLVKEGHRKAKQKKLMEQREVRRRVAGVKLMRQLLPDVVTEVANELLTNGTWVLQDRTNAEQVVLPSLEKESKQILQLYDRAREVLDGR